MAESVQPSEISLVGIDMARQSQRRSQGVSLPWIAVGIIAALCIVGLRIDLIRMGYARAEALKIEQTLRQQERDLTLKKGRLSKHVRLIEEAQRRGFEQAGSIIDLPIASLYPVASGPGERELRP
jgi:hypothetical protein